MKELKNTKYCYNCICINEYKSPADRRKKFSRPYFVNKIYKYFIDKDGIYNVYFNHCEMFKWSKPTFEIHFKDVRIVRNEKILNILDEI